MPQSLLERGVSSRSNLFADSSKTMSSPKFASMAETPTGRDSPLFLRPSSKSKSRPGTSQSKDSGHFRAALWTEPDISVHSNGAWAETSSRPSTSEGHVGKLSPMRVPPRLAYIHRVTLSDSMDEFNKSPLYRQLERALHKLSPEGGGAERFTSKQSKKPKPTSQISSKNRPKTAMEKSLTADTYAEEPLPLNRSHLKPLDQDEAYIIRRTPSSSHKKGRGKKTSSVHRKKLDLDDFTPLSIDDLQTTKAAMIRSNVPYGHGYMGSMDGDKDLSMDLGGNSMDLSELQSLSFEEQKRRLSSDMNTRTKALFSAMKTRVVKMSPARAMVQSVQKLMDAVLPGKEDETTISDSSRPSTAHTAFSEIRRGAGQGRTSVGSLVADVPSSPPGTLKDASGGKKRGESAHSRGPSESPPVSRGSTVLRAASPSASGAKERSVGSASAARPQSSGVGRPQSSLKVSSSSGDKAEEDNVLDPRTKHGKLLVWSLGDLGTHGEVASNALPELRDEVRGDLLDLLLLQIWHKASTADDRSAVAAFAIQRNWKRYRHSTKFLRYKLNRARRLGQNFKNLFSLWARVSIQRPEARTFLSQFLIAWRVLVCERNIAWEKASDLYMMWVAVCSKRNLKAWRRLCKVQQHCLRLRKWRAFGPWWGFVEVIKKRKLLGKKNVNEFLHHAIRALYFWTRCAAKCRKRAYKLYRYFDDSLDPLTMPLARFPGYSGCVFLCDYMLELWQWKDVRERKIIRHSYVRLIPQIVRRWSLGVDLNKRHRYASVHAKKQLLLRVIRMLKKNAERPETEKVEDASRGRRMSFMEDLQADAAALEQVRGAYNNMNQLAELVDHEEKEQLRRRIKEEKRKLVIRMRFDQLRREAEILRKLPEQLDESMRALDVMLHESDKRYHQKLNEERQLLRDEAKRDQEAWQKTIEAFRTLLHDACSILENVFDRAQTEYSQGVFYSCWCFIRRPAGKIRVRRILNRSHIQRLLTICARHRRMSNSIHKFRPLRVKWSAWNKWLKYVEEQYLTTSVGVKDKVVRERELSLKLSAMLLEMGKMPTVREACKRKDLVFAFWLERVYNQKARREVIHLFNVRQSVRILYRTFDFLRDGVMWREKKQHEVIEHWVEKNATQDLLVWKKKFFCGTGYAQVLRKVEHKSKVKSMALVKGSLRLAPLMTQRRQLVDARIQTEQRMLLLELDDIERREQEAALKSQGQRRLLASQFPVQHWGTVLNLRRNDLMNLLDRCDHFAKVARREFDSARVAFSLSEWLFKIKCNGLPNANDTVLTRDKAYWSMVKNLFQLARNGKVNLKPT